MALLYITAGHRAQHRLFQDGWAIHATREEFAEFGSRLEEHFHNRANVEVDREGLRTVIYVHFKPAGHEPTDRYEHLGTRDMADLLELAAECLRLWAGHRSMPRESIGV